VGCGADFGHICRGLGDRIAQVMPADVAPILCCLPLGWTGRRGAKLFHYGVYAICAAVCAGTGLAPAGVGDCFGDDAVAVVEVEELVMGEGGYSGVIWRNKGN